MPQQSPEEVLAEDEFREYAGASYDFGFGDVELESA